MQMTLCSFARPKEGIYASNLKLILYSFELLIGLKINFEKSSLIEIMMSDSKVKYFADSMGCSVDTLPTKYLDYSLHSSKLKNSDWGLIIEKIEKRLSMWKNKVLSIAGRSVLMNAILGLLL